PLHPRSTLFPYTTLFRSLRLLVMLSAVSLLILAAVILTIVLTGKSSGKVNDKSVAAAMRAAGCTYQDVKIPAPPKGQTTHIPTRSEEHTSELQSRGHLVC